VSDANAGRGDLTPLTDEEQSEKDMSYSPASESETQAKQDAPADPRDPDVDPDAVKVLPGTGGPDDPGDVVLEE